jgi:hypothetical protein
VADIATTEVRTFVFDEYMRLCDDLAGAPSTVAHISSGVRARFPDLPIKHIPRNVARWLANPAKHTPHIDEVAMKRAADFEWAVVERLSDDEHSLLYERIGKMIDPFSIGFDRELLKASGMDWTQRTPSPRRTRWEAGTKRQRDTLSNGVRRAGSNG